MSTELLLNAKGVFLQIKDRYLKRGDPADTMQVKTLGMDARLRGALDLLQRKRLLQSTSNGSGYIIGDLGVEVALGERDLDEVLGLPRSAPATAAPVSSPQQATAATSAPGLYDGWEKNEKLGEGGQGAAYRAVNAELLQQGALKLLKRPQGMSEEEWSQAVGRSRREIQILKELRHPCVLQVLANGENAEGPWLVSELHPQGSLQKVGQALRGDVWRCLRLARDVAVALDVVHDKGIVHRDVKPQNIFLKNLQQAVLGDFGIAHVSDATQLTNTSEAVGANWFRPPEADHGRLDEPSPSFDVYSLGKVIYWMVSGGQRFKRERFRETSADLVTLLGRPELEAINALLDRMVVEEPERRFQKMNDVVQAIDRTVSMLFGRQAFGTCEVCGEGEMRAAQYELRADHFAMRLRAPDGTGTDPHVEVCSKCGHPLRQDSCRSS